MRAHTHTLLNGRNLGQCPKIGRLKGSSMDKSTDYIQSNNNDVGGCAYVKSKTNCKKQKFIVSLLHYGVAAAAAAVAPCIIATRQVMQST